MHQMVHRPEGTRRTTPRAEDQRRRGRVVALAVAAWCLLLLAGCARPPDTAGPIAAVERFVAALEARDASAIIAGLEPSDWRGEIGPELRTYLGMLRRVELHDERYRVVSGDETTAVVELRGTLAYSFAEGAAGERAFELLIETVRVGERWYLRGVELPQPEG